ncbi:MULTISPECIES: type 2 isopentenyl-diphosphate Delta-isomerase [unclassified Lentimicrobium]|uniref:type 2 isopentenyl-diphosphate Delta-isomerase n=1 Tax=unclassified Lentimicrobium TaxID=2677434 RepID=UPI001556A684|nr:MULTISPECIES: type 2 isopentenyl-diphosphate Delta-isomerase [unclassified Lentimicrobium]NPD46560.1 type 2 isopentenyl-diphosphate Delta-isomerase [Lentimicrobium sp. S6]NPD85703.1 type 2 isopentenyl-diphosphate Delta-isomerase [Lentimicrobium sp. L6]
MESRKKDHINLAYQAQMFEQEVSELFNYEPMLVSNQLEELKKTKFLAKELSLPLWVSSMTGGTKEAQDINRNLAQACREFGMGMGLGSCRPLLQSKERFEDFNVRDIMGNDLPLMANLGIAQVEDLLDIKAVDKIIELVTELRADGLMLHVNPLQELMQPEGDIYKRPPLETIQELLELIDFPIFVKEVGQGMGPKSLDALLETDIAGIEFGALGGTNFSLIELMRSDEMVMEQMSGFASVGHSAADMVGFLNELPMNMVQQKELIVSGGMNPLRGYYMLQQLSAPAIIGMAFQFLKYAREDYSELKKYVTLVKRSLQIAEKFLHKL